MGVLCKPTYIYEFTVDQTFFEIEVRFMLNNFFSQNLAIVM